MKKSMRKIVQFKHTTYENGTLFLHTDQAELLQGTTAAGQIIADSDRYAFVYLAENEEEYVYLYLEESIWDELKKALQEKNAVIAKSDDYSLELDQFTEELDYLVTNIEGNGNYGDEMVKKVESVFLDK
jgi:L-rhamnose mutarotase